MELKTFIAFIISSVYCFGVAGSPNGSPVCTVGSAASQGSHLSRQPGFLGGISDGNFIVKIGDTTLDSSIVNKIPGGTMTVLDLRSTNDSEFRGVLIVLNKDGIDLSSNLTTSAPGFKEQATCHHSGYSGFTHADRDPKKFVQGNITLPINQEVFLDVNIVVANNFVKGSIFYHTQFQLLAETTSSIPIKSPVRAPRTSPIKTTSRAPKIIPIRAPVQSPLKAPVRVPIRLTVKEPAPRLMTAPIRAPMKIPSVTPLRRPIKAPVMAKRPIAAPRRAPIKVPSVASGQEPMKSPVKAPIKVPTVTSGQKPIKSPVTTVVQAPKKTPICHSTKAPAVMSGQEPLKSPMTAPKEVQLIAPVQSPIKSQMRAPARAPSPVRVVMKAPVKANVMSQGIVPTKAPRQASYGMSIFSLRACGLLHRILGRC
jgi:hypothetical protein